VAAAIRQLQERLEDKQEEKAAHERFIRISLEAAEAIKRDGNWPSNQWPSLHERAWWMGAQEAIRDLAAQLSEAQGQVARLEAQLQELAAAAEGYRMAECHVGVTQEQLRAANARLGSLAGPHLMASAKAATAPQEPQ
jgi:hypothetical protein